MFNIILNNSRSFGGYESITSQRDAEVWREIDANYATSEVTDSEGKPVLIEIDWSSRLAYEERCAQLYAGPERASPTADGPFRFEHAHTCPASVQLPGESDGAAEEKFLHRQLLEIYLVANLSCPGTFNLYRSYIRHQGRDPATDPLAQTDLEISEYVFETAWHEARSLSWLKVDFLPFGDVLAWYNDLQIRDKNTANTDVERALFSLLHLGRASFLDPTAVMWLAGSLEALYDTPSGSSFSFLCKRISVLLGLQKAETAELRKRMRAFFDVRNAFVHGGSAILHPLTDFEDKAVDAEVASLLQTTNFAAAVLIGSIQELVRRKWLGLAFEETVRAA